jgi:hypothetical protein
MQYSITKPFIGYTDFIEISCDEYEAVKIAKQNLLEALTIEEKFNLVLENYAEFERELLELSLNHMMVFDHDWFSFQREIYTINRRIINLLTTCRLYISQVLHNVNSIYGEKAGLAEAIKNKMSNEYDSNLSYRVLEALRNYVQHRGLPVYELQHRLERQGGISGRYFKRTITPSLSVSRLKEDKEFKSSVLKELEETGDLIDIKPHIRNYIDSIGRIHLFIRELLEKDIADWDTAIYEIQKRFREALDDDVEVLTLEVRDDMGSPTESVQIFDEIIRHRQWLTRKNQMVTHFSSDIISSEARPRDA